MTLIQIKNLTFRYDNSFENVFDHVSFSFDSSYKSALIGRNGRGKSTLLKLLMNQYEYRGEILIKEKCEYFPYYVENTNQWTLDVCYEIEPTIQQWQLEKELNQLNVDSGILYRIFDTLSKGEQTKVLLAILFLKPNSYLLIDEPTNHLDQESREIVASYLKKQKGFLLVSHDRSFIDQCCDHIIAMNPSSIDVVQGSFTSWYEDKTRKDESEIEKNIRLKKNIGQMEASRKQTENWSNKVEKSKNGRSASGLKQDKGYVGHKAAKMMKRSKNIENRMNKAIEEKRSLLKDIEVYDDLKLAPLEYFQNTLCSFFHVSIFYDNQFLFKDLNLIIHKGERILLKGKNGCGKSSVIRMIISNDIEYKGDFIVGSRLKISYVPQDCSWLNGNLDELIDQYHVDHTLVKTILRKLGFSRSQFEMNMEYYSEGQKKKVLLAISLSTSAHLYIWDEPLNYIDIYSRIQIENLIKEYQPTLLFVEHDAFFQKEIATKIIDYSHLV